MQRWIAVVAVAAVALFAASFAVARSGRPEAQRPPARGDSAPAALERVKTASGVGKLRRLELRSLPALKREPVEPADDPQPVDPQPVSPQPVNPQPVDPQPVSPQPVNPRPVDPQPTDPEPKEPPPGSGCDPCG